MTPTIQLVATIFLALFILACAWTAFLGKPEERKLGWAGLAFCVFVVLVNSAFKADEALFITRF